jgi:16S rRNA (guanine527-N7)-methyltransferase
LPGIPVAIARPDLNVTLLDSNSKKTAFLQQAILELGLKNVKVICARVERPLHRTFDVIVSRAFAEIGDFVSASCHLLAPGGVLMAMKGINPIGEIARLLPGFRIREAIPLKVPGLDAERHLIVIEVA